MNGKRIFDKGLTTLLKVMGWGSISLYLMILSTQFFLIFVTGEVEILTPIADLEVQVAMLKLLAGGLLSLKLAELKFN